MANETVGIDIVARLDKFRSELAQIPNIGAKEARQLATQLSREIKGVERASRAAAQAAQAHAAAQRSVVGAMTKAAVNTAALMQGMRLLARSVGAAMDRMVELDTAAGGNLRASLDSAREACTSLIDTALLPLIPVVSDVVAGFAEAARVVAGLTAQTEAARAAQGKAQDAIIAQAEKVSALRAEIERLKAADLGSAFGAADPRIAATTAEMERQLKVLRRLKGEMGAEAGIGPRPSAATPRAAATAAPKAAAPIAGIGEAIEESSDGGRDALRELEDAIADATQAALSGEAAIIAAGEARKRNIEEVLAAVVSSSGVGTAVQVEAVREAAAVRVQIEAETQAQIDALRQEQHENELQRIEDERQRRARAAASWLGMTSNVTGAISDLVDVAAEHEIASTREGSEERRRAMQRAWEAQTALAIAQAAINIPLSIAQAAAGPWPAAIGFMVAAGAASTLAFAGVVAKAAAGPSFHTGGTVGRAPDEMSITALEGEGILSRDAVRRAGGPEGVRRLNRGEPEDDRPIVVVSKIGHRTLDVTTHESLRRRRGPLYDAIRTTQPRVGLHSPW